MSIAKSLGAGIAHEMRNPLSTIHTSFDILKSLIPEENAENRTISSKDLKTIHQLLSGVEDVMVSADETIDLILTSIDQHRVSTSTFRQHSVLTVIQKTLSSFSYHCDEDRHSIYLEQDFNFDFFGSDTLLKYALYNLLKNSFYYRKDNNFHIHIKIIKQNKWNQIIFEDNGAGIASEHVEHIFKDFYTYGKNGGFGLGLPFCRRIMTSFGGHIRCESSQGEWTRFILSFPESSSTQVSHMKQQILKMKSMLYIRYSLTDSSDNAIVNLLQKEYSHLEVIDLEDAIGKKDYEFEYDIIFVNLEQITQYSPQLAALEKLLFFSRAQICYLFGQHQQNPIEVKRDFPVIPLKTRHITATYFRNIIEKLLFGAKLPIDKKLPPQIINQQQTGKHILIVDDNHSVRTFTALLLEKQGYEVLQANDGTEALNSVDNQKIDLILMDIEMPVMDGIEAARQIRSSNKPYRHIPIIGHTGDSQAKTLEKIKASGMNDYIIKPVQKEQLLGKVACLI
ncbi:ATP-binding response regulator [Vibrio quintilis]|uniref:ATP-binding response regulator n=1 Tax=Vibrio quintilis TaxID=1117707 RepID=UPI001F231A6D|nr:hybrid sensor histidine kinase/response regulator [Vibrio quintilis]